jgi:hypothetical protein
MSLFLAALSNVLDQINKMIAGEVASQIHTVAKLWQNYRVRSGFIGFSPASDSPVSD